MISKTACAMNTSHSATAIFSILADVLEVLHSVPTKTKPFINQLSSEKEKIQSCFKDFFPQEFVYRLRFLRFCLQHRFICLHFWVGSSAFMWLDNRGASSSWKTRSLQDGNVPSHRIKLIDQTIPAKMHRWNKKHVKKKAISFNLPSTLKLLLFLL